MVQVRLTAKPDHRHDSVGSLTDLHHDWLLTLALEMVKLVKELRCYAF